jgi:hypothetical protein
MESSHPQVNMNWTLDRGALPTTSTPDQKAPRASMITTEQQLPVAPFLVSPQPTMIITRLPTSPEAVKTTEDTSGTSSHLIDFDRFEQSEEDCRSTLELLDGGFRTSNHRVNMLAVGTGSKPGEGGVSEQPMYAAPHEAITGISTVRYFIDDPNNLEKASYNYVKHWNLGLWKDQISISPANSQVARSWRIQDAMGGKQTLWEIMSSRIDPRHDIPRMLKPMQAPSKTATSSKVIKLDDVSSDPSFRATISAPATVVRRRRGSNLIQLSNNGSIEPLPESRFTPRTHPAKRSSPSESSSELSDVEHDENGSEAFNSANVRSDRVRTNSLPRNATSHQKRHEPARSNERNTSLPNRTAQVKSLRPPASRSRPLPGSRKNTNRNSRMHSTTTVSPARLDSITPNPNKRKRESIVSSTSRMLPSMSISDAWEIWHQGRKGERRPQEVCDAIRSMTGQRPPSCCFSARSLQSSGDRLTPSTILRHISNG